MVERYGEARMGASPPLDSGLIQLGFVGGNQEREVPFLARAVVGHGTLLEDSDRINAGADRREARSEIFGGVFAG